MTNRLKAGKYVVQVYDGDAWVTIGQPNPNKATLIRWRDRLNARMPYQYRVLNKYTGKEST